MNAGPSTSLPEKPDNHLIIRGLGCIRGGRHLFRKLDLTLQPGQAALVTGPNGVGKSSLLRLVAGLLEPAAGSIDAPDSIALCDDNMAIDEELPLEKALAFWARLDGRNQAEIGNAMTAAGLDHLAEVPVRYFSTGQRQRARLARTYLSRASLWLLDEPANGLDTASVEQLELALRTYLEAGGIVLAASHIALPIAFDATIRLKPPGNSEERL